MPKIISEETKYEGPRFNVVQRIYEDEKTNKKYVRDSVELLPAAMILPITDNKLPSFILYNVVSLSILPLILPMLTI